MSHDALVGDWPGDTARAPVAPLVRMVSGMAGIDATAWKAARPPESEGWAYLAACETSPPAALELAAVSVGDRAGLAAAAPLFALKYRLDTPLQDGPLAAFCDRLARRAPGLMEWRMLGVGSTFTDACPVALSPRLCEAGRAKAVAGLIAAVEAEAARRGTGLVVFKDLAPRELALLAPHLAAARYFAVESLPVAVLDLDGTGDLDGYLARLSPATRKDLRRKMKRAERVEVEWRTSLAGMEGEVRALYEATRTRSQVRYGDFEDLPDGYFETVSRALGTDAVFACYRVGGQLAAFNLLFVEPDRVIDKFLGMAYPLGPAHDLYALSWLENVRFCQRIGRRYLQTGQTAYASKLRFGSALEPRTHLVKHRNRALHAVLRLAAPLLAFPRWDPDLRRLGREGAR
ncbi:GNAT family N-acetyltransferase [Xanthobacter sp. 126]|uniref:GNAT family N-acetyltransferase n=1 Tax=Xanthobacter sp. 126 TaxID=1131814 RepID=UPI00045E60A1|nr:GNAT family N-acetyltransferase [Xanthobacter sp. 126]